MKFGLGYHSACTTPKITGPFVFDENDGLYRSDYKKHRGKMYYKVVYSYDQTKLFFSYDYVAYTLIWETSGEPMAVGFGNGMGKHFLERPYKKWIEMGVKEEDTIPYEEAPSKSRYIQPSLTTSRASINKQMTEKEIQSTTESL